MSKNVNHLLSLTAVLMLTGLTACGPSDDNATTADIDVVPDATLSDSTVIDPADTTMADSSAAGSTDSMMTGSMAAGKAQISVTNPMPHEMIVSADMGQGPKELGPVMPSETKTFEVEAAPGTTVNLVATDAEKTHSPKGSVTVEADAPATWTIQ